MRKSFYIFVTCILFSTNVFADNNNILCGNKPTTDEFCKKIIDSMYEGLLSGYTNGSNQSVQTNNPEKLSEIKQLVPYDTFYKYMQTCGENQKELNKARDCILTKFQELINEKIK